MTALAAISAIRASLDRGAVERAGVPLVDTKDDVLRTKLIAAGYKAPHAPRVYTLIRLMLVIGLPLALFAWISLSGSSPSIIRLYFTLIIAAAAGLYVPALFISAKAGRRQETMINSFPDALDLMLVCVEAGWGSRPPLPVSARKWPRRTRCSPNNRGWW